MTPEERQIAGRVRERAHERLLDGEINEAEFLSVAAIAMQYMPEQFMQWLEGYASSRFEAAK